MPKAAVKQGLWCPIWHRGRIFVPKLALGRICPIEVLLFHPLLLLLLLLFLFLLFLLLRWRYSSWWGLASFTIRLQASRYHALPLHSIISTILRSVDMSSSHPIFGLPLLLVAYSFPYNIFLELRCLAFFLCDPSIIFFDI